MVEVNTLYPPTSCLPINKDLILLFCQIKLRKHIKTLGILGIYRHIISIIYRIYKYYEKKIASIFAR